MSDTARQFSLISNGTVFGSITSEQAAVCAEWLRDSTTVTPLVEFFDWIANYEDDQP